ncbi:hypothetical protein [Terrisporobacter sp.]|uniref:hypothetical protein n=1 Tax=Terrisporobacter sp. TaxID=1965305 RepID=UPI0026216205|nr:hypothetical protein [Terrisporobacter sp.]
MLYTKEYLSGNDIDLRKYNLGIIKQLKVDDFMKDYDLIDFVKPFYMEQSLDLKDEIHDSGIHWSYYLMMSSNENELLSLLLDSLRILYRTEDLNIKAFDEDVKLIIKRDNKPIAFIDDSNFNILCKVMLEMCYFEKPEPEPEIKGDAELIRIKKMYDQKYGQKSKDKNVIVFEEMVRQVMHYRKLTYNDVKDWTIWFLKDVYTVECLSEVFDKQYLMFTNSNRKVDLKEVKRWQDETKLVRE